jgi:hypothetical protein
MKPLSKSVSLVLALLFLYAAIIPHSHSSADEGPFHHGEPCGSGCTVTPGLPASHDHGCDLHENASNSTEPRYFHFLLESDSAVSSARFSAESPKSPENFTAVVDVFTSAGVRYFVSRSADSSDFVPLTRFQTIPTGLSPPCV